MATQVWRRQHPRRVRYVTSGPPRDLVGLRDMRQVENPYQRRMIRELEERDAKKFAAGHAADFNYVVEERFPEDINVPRNQKLDYYLRKGFEAAKNDLFGHAYYYFMEAMKKAKTASEAHRYNESALSNLKEWRRVYGS